MKRKIVQRIFGMLAFLALPQHTALALDKVRIGLTSVSAIHGAMWAAEEKGLFKKHGIEPELVIIAGEVILELVEI